MAGDDSQHCLCLVASYSKRAELIAKVTAEVEHRVSLSPVLGDSLVLRYLDLGPEPGQAGDRQRPVRKVAAELRAPAAATGRNHFALIVIDKSASTIEQVLASCGAEPFLAGFRMRFAGIASNDDRADDGPRADIVASPHGAWRDPADLAAALHRQCEDLLRYFAARREPGLTSAELDTLKRAYEPTDDDDTAVPAIDKAAGPADVLDPATPVTWPPPSADDRPAPALPVQPGAEGRLGPGRLAGVASRLLPEAPWRRRTQAAPEAAAPPAGLGLVYLLTLAEPGMSQGLALDALHGVLREVDNDLAHQPDCAFEVRLVHGNDDRLRGDRQPAGLLTRRALRRPLEVTRFDEVFTSVRAALRRDLAEIETAAGGIGAQVARPAVVLVTTDPPIADHPSVVAFRKLAADATVVWLVPRKTEGLVNPVFGDRAPAVVLAESESAAGRIRAMARTGLPPTAGSPFAVGGSGSAVPGELGMEFQVTVTDLRRPDDPAENDCVISAASGHRVADLSAALHDALASNWEAGRLSAGARGGGRTGLQEWSSPWSRTAAEGLWLNGSRLPEDKLLTDAGIRAGSRLGLGGPVAEHAASGTFAATVTGGAPEPLVSVYPDPGDPFFQVVHKQPRAGLSPPRPVTVSSGPVAAAAPVAMPRTPWLQLLLGPAIAIGASAAMSVAMGGRNSWVFLLVGLSGSVGSTVPQLVNLRKSRKAAREQASLAKQAAAASSEQQAASASAVADAIAAEEQFLRRLLPDPELVVKIATRPGRRLWERSPGQDDFLRIRFGIGDRPAASVTARGGQPLSPDAAGQSPVARSVPIAADLGALGVLGIAGDARVSRGILAWSVMQLAVAHGPSDLRLVLLTDDQAAWRWVRWLPHVRPPGDPDGWLNVGTDQVSRHKRVTELRELIGGRLGGPGTGLGAAGWPAQPAGASWGGAPGAASPARFTGHSGQLPAVVLVIDGYAQVRHIPGIEEVLAYGPAAGVLVLCRDDHRRELPRYCAALLEADLASGAGTYQEPGSGRLEQVTRLDRVRGSWADAAARALAPLRDRASDTAAGKDAPVRLNELWNYEQMNPAVVRELWRRRQRSTRVPLGTLSDETPFVLDIARDGPHMLVGGTTGSGKSEFLQTFIASLVHANPPDALNFVLIDYKGGAAFEAYSRLPHVTGFLRNLDDHLGKRVLLALSAEMKYRQRLLAEARCPSIESYWAADSPAGPLPRLLIVVDEFARLKEEMPEVLAEMTKVTVIGRSVGVHLVLATQRPAGVVTPDIQANTALRLALRVEDAPDSTAVIGIPDAHLISKRAPGRGFARTESSTVVAFQGAYVGGPADGGARAAGDERPLAPLTAGVRPFGRAGLSAPLDDSEPVGNRASYRRKGPTDLSVLVDAVLATGEEAPARKAWLDPLPSALPLSALASLTRREPGLLAPLRYGMGDLPGEQRRAVAAFDVESGLNLLIGGAAQTGKTTALRTLAAEIARSCSPGDVHLYVLDCDTGALGPLQRLPHCGAVVRHTEADRAARLFDRLEAEIDRRRNLLADRGFASVGEQRAAVPAGERLPYLVMLLDGWEEFNSTLGQLDGNRLAASLTRLATQGAGAGLRVIATGGLQALGKLASSFPRRIVLRLSGPGDLAGLGVPRGAMPANPGPGRGVLLPSATEVQLAYAGTGPDGAAQMAALSDLIETARQQFPSPAPVPLRVDALPSRVPLATALTLPGWPGCGPLQPVLAVGGDELGWQGPDLTRYPGFAIAGPALSGKSTALVVLAESLLAAGSQVVALAPRESPLRGLAGRGGVLAVFTDTRPDSAQLAERMNAADRPLAVLVDDAELLVGHPSTEQILANVLAIARDQGGALVVASSVAYLGRPSRSFLTAVPQLTRCGLLLTPEDRGQAMLFGARLPGNSVFTRPAGRGFLVQANQAVLVQVPDLPGPPADR